MSLPIIEVQNLSKRYRLGRIGATTLREDLGRMAKRLRGATAGEDQRDFWALRDVSFSVRHGEVLGVIGRNGAGKSTLLKILSRITEPTSGRAVLRGRVASLLEVGTGFHQDLTGRENVYLNGAILGMKRAEIAARFDEIVAFAEVEKFIDTPVKHYSSGMRVRLAFAVAAHLDSEILIADEVLAVGDASFQRRCVDKVQALNRSGRSVIFVSHNIAQVAAICSRCLWLTDGHATRMGPQDEVLADYIASGHDRHELSVDLSDWPRPAGLGGIARLTRLDWLSPNPLPQGQPLIWSIHGISSRRSTEVAAGLGLSSPDGVRLVSIESDWRATRWSLEGDRSFVIEGRLEALNLAPGVYTVTVGLRSGGTGMLDHAAVPGQLQITLGDAGLAAIAPTGSGLHLKADWAPPRSPCA